ncbi:MAG: dicarboxylate/amino acid:cation symporter [Fimbriimonadales bacterium]|nr:dicarboxylate/amino acid:cation symporter [Fimbriimonadales bacterium]
MASQARIAVISIPALCLGLIIGIAAHSTGSDVLKTIGSWVAPLGEVWTNYLRLVAIPLIICLLIATVARMQRGGALGKIGGVSLATFAAFLILGGVIALAVGIPLMRWMPPAIDGMALPAAEDETQADQAGGTFGDWLVKLVPTNAFAAAASGELLPLLVVTLLFALSVRCISEPSRDIIVSLFIAVGEAMMKLISWAIIVMPIGVFALAFGFGMQHGAAIAGVAAYFIAFISAMCVLFVLLMYPIAAIVGKLGFRRFAVGVAPSQTVAASTRSSLATLPTVMDGAERSIGMSPATVSFVLPLAASIFKPNRTLTSVAKLIFVAALFGVALDPGTILVFFATVAILSVGTPGIPSGAGYTTMGAYVAIGIPVEGYIFFKSLDPIPDVFKTIVNVTGFMAVASIVDRVTANETQLDQLEPIRQA